MMKEDKSEVHYHTSVLLHESINGLAIKPNGIYVDATFGGGGHSKEILKQLGEDGKLFGFDQDEDAVKNAPDDNRFTLVQANFRELKRFLRLHDALPVDGILADLGVSSWQFDTAERGFSYRFDGPMDMRMNRLTEKTAADVLNEYSAEQLQKMFSEYGEVRNSKTLANGIFEVKAQKEFAAITELLGLYEANQSGKQQFGKFVFNLIKVSTQKRQSLVYGLGQENLY